MPKALIVVPENNTTMEAGNLRALSSAGADAGCTGEAAASYAAAGRPARLRATRRLDAVEPYRRMRCSIW